ncbi:MAG: hypothetical protein Q9227_003154 [Pyrenula ochraceoflavens]
MSSSNTDVFLKITKDRRTYYQLKNSSPVPDKRIQEIVEHAIRYCPSSFNTQSTRCLILFKKDHEKLWDLTTEILRPMVPDEESWKSKTEPRMKGFRAGYATILFFEDTLSVQPLREMMGGIFADKATQWSDHSNAMHQYLVWCALESEGLGVNLQHYNPLIDSKVRDTWGVPSTWVLTAQMVCGEPAGMPGEKTSKPVEGERVMVKGAN